VNTEKINPRLTATTVKGYIRHQTVGLNQLSDLITSVHQVLAQLGQPPEPDEVRMPAVPVRRSVYRDYVVCLDCGYRGKTLRRHISARHGLSRDEYLRRWGMRSDHPLTAPGYSERRSVLAKQLGLGRKSMTKVHPVEMPIAGPATADADGNSNGRRPRRPRAVSNSGSTPRDGAVSTQEKTPT
jgi:predicted transcriptional regulator